MKSVLYCGPKTRSKAGRAKLYKRLRSRLRRRILKQDPENIRTRFTKGYAD